MAPRHPLPQRPSTQPNPNASGGYPNASRGYPNASGGYPNASGGYPNASGGYPNASGGYPSASGGYPWAAASGGYPYPQAHYNPGFNASGGYPGYGAGAYGYGVHNYAAHPYAPSTGPSSASSRGRGGRGGGAGAHGMRQGGDTSMSQPETKRSEEEERWAKGGGSAYIQGTGITLDTPEQIAAWIAERRKKFPTAQRVAERKEEEAAAIARGENPRKRKLDAARAAEEWGRETEVGQHAKGAVRGRGQGRVNAAPRKVSKGDQSSDSSGSESDSDSSSDLSESSEDDEDEGDDEDKAEDEEEKDKGKDKENDIRAPAASNVCRFFARGQCRFGARCKLEHTRPNAAERAEEPKGPPKPRPPRVPRGPPPNAFARPSMLGAILANPIENTLSQLSQTIRFLVANDMLRGVEVRAGQAEEEKREREKIVVVEGEGGGT
ncbi:hypothetical protein CspeluHIS016_0902460 [Cutaneotrichosporon spelunceum]|uniref:C3H1-type domain-containing protein n=1 Tax=Cutaneotrichosporon spelunceum TaxID=1672016 RepID=A0AAD3U014_9TREE|nr:hypothetical protein CspeluHIS016_0902460 [Cutaneotrichosporon spelunceum]